MMRHAKPLALFAILSTSLCPQLLEAATVAEATVASAGGPAQAAQAEPGPLTLVRIWPGWRSAESFSRISEYFGGGENRNRQTILRSQPDARAGFYFLIRIKNQGPELHDAHFELQVIRPDSPHAKTYRFPAGVATGSHVYTIGLTGSDWPGWEHRPAADTHPVAWQLRLLDNNGRELLRKQSFLWAMPAHAAEP